MKLKFFKMQAQGNDYIYFDFMKKKPPLINYSDLAEKLSKRRFSIGSDGIIIIENKQNYDAAIRIFNADGSEANICGSALRSVTAYLADHNAKNNYQIWTKAGSINAQVTKKEDKSVITVEMGKVGFIENKKLKLYKFEGYQVSVGNSHFVIYLNQLDADITSIYGPLIENHEKFTDKMNVEFVRKISDNEIEVKVWEQGSGETLACGSGACAAVYTGLKKYGLSENVKVNFPGGSVMVRIAEETAFLSGEVEFVFQGEIDL